MPVDTPIYVRDLETQDWIPRYFAKCEDDKVFAWTDGKTSWSAKEMTAYWKYAKLADPQKTDDERVVEAAKTIKEHCKNNNNCSYCVLIGDAICALDGQPDEWEV